MLEEKEYSIRLFQLGENYKIFLLLFVYLYYYFIIIICYFSTLMWLRCRISVAMSSITMSFATTPFLTPVTITGETTHLTGHQYYNPGIQATLLDHSVWDEATKQHTQAAASQRDPGHVGAHGFLGDVGGIKVGLGIVGPHVATCRTDYKRDGYSSHIQPHVEQIIRELDIVGLYIQPHVE